MKPQPDVEFAAFVGIDWSDAKHDICLQAAHSEDREFRRPAASRCFDRCLGLRAAPTLCRPAGGGVPGARQGTTR